MMNRMMNMLTVRGSLQHKLLLLILLVATIPLLALGYVLYNKSSQIINEQFGKYGDTSVSQLQFQIDASLSQMKYSVNEILSYLIDPKFIVLHEEVPSSYIGFQDEQQLEQFLKAHKTVDTKGIHIITKSGYYYGERSIHTGLLKRQTWYNDMNGERDAYKFNIYEPRHYIDSTSASGEKVIGLLFLIRNQVGVLKGSRILVEVKADKLLNLFKEFEKNTGSALTVTDDETRSIVYRTAGAPSPQGNDIVWTNRSAETDWSIEVRTPYSTFYQSSLFIRTFTFTAVSLSLLLAFLLAYYIAYRFLRRIKRLKESIHLVSIGNLDTRIPIDSEDEIGRLSHHFNSMVRQLNMLIEEVKRVEQMKKEAELRAFHHQINPHLLINTLASIQWKARLDGAKDVSVMIHHLTKVLEGNLTLTQEIVTLEQELEVIDHYLKVQELRFGPVFTYRIVNRGVDLQGVQVPRMTLQPLVENIFFHGFEDGKGNIELLVERDDDGVVVSLSDNGKGMDGDKRELLLEVPRSESGSKSHIGMYNVNRKIKLHFGETYGLTVLSQIGRGTTIVIRLPKREEN